MSTATAPPPVRTRLPHHVVARWAGGLALAHVVVLLGAFAVEGTASLEHGMAPSTLQHNLKNLDVTRTLLSGYVEALAFFVLVPAIVLVARTFSRRTEVGRLAAQAFVVLGTAFIASTLAIGFPPGAAALYAAHHGVGAGTLATVEDLRNYSFVLQVALSAGMALALGVAALAERLHTRWIGWGGIAVGVVGLVATPFAHNTVSSLWMIWWVGMGVVLLREKDQLD
jgi:hypothetical protein